MWEWELIMCGIVGLFLKDASLEISLGTLLGEMLVTMTDRGPDSAGIAIYAQKEQSFYIFAWSALLYPNQ